LTTHTLMVNHNYNSIYQFLAKDNAVLKLAATLVKLWKKAFAQFQAPFCIITTLSASKCIWRLQAWISKHRRGFLSLSLTNHLLCLLLYSVEDLVKIDGSTLISLHYIHKQKWCWVLLSWSLALHFFFCRPSLYFPGSATKQKKTAESGVRKRCAFGLFSCLFIETYSCCWDFIFS